MTVVPAIGAGVVPSAEVTLNAQAAFGNGAAESELATMLTGFTERVGHGHVRERAGRRLLRQGRSRGARRRRHGRVGAPGSITPIQVQLGASGIVAGRVLLPDGVTPAAGAFVTLRFQSQSSLQSGVLQVTTGLTGTFEFGGIPLGTFTLSAIEVVSSGVPLGSRHGDEPTDSGSISGV